MKQYKTILADPPWMYKHTSKGPRSRGSAAKNYPCLATEDIKKLPVKQFADTSGCFLFLWVTSSHLRDGLDVMETWGFEYKQILTWVKRRIGMGYYFRMATEHILLGVIGKPEVKVRHLPSWFRARRTVHSGKPARFYDWIEMFCDGPRLELFARKKRKSWDAWGNEVKSDIELH